MRDLFLAVDGNSLMHRAFHALPPMDANGVCTNAVHGFLSMLLKVLRDYEPRYTVVAFDEHAPTFRHQMYADYKAGRRPTPEELRMQFPVLREILSAMHIAAFSMAGFEADDILGTVARRCAESRDLTAMLLTGDRDALQLVDDQVQVLFTRKGISETTLFDPAAVRAAFGVTPSQITDLKGLMGDQSDNIPGVPGVGEKTAVKLLNEYGTLENVLAHGADIKGKLGEKIRGNADKAVFSKDLATIRPTVPMDLTPSNYLLAGLTDGVPVLRRYQLNAIIQRLEALSDAAPESAGTEAPVLPAESLTGAEDALRFIREAGDAPLCLHLTEEGLSLCTETRFACLTFRRDMLDDGPDAAETLAALRAPLSERPLIVHDGKRLMHICGGQGLPLPQVAFDTMLGAYLLNPQEKSYALSALASDDAQGVWRLYARQKDEIPALGMDRLLYEVEIPLSYVLFDMEKTGFQIDPGVLRRLGEEWHARAETLKQEIYDLTGAHGFNLNSPQQLGRVLFEDLKLPHGKKTSKGYATDADTLENLRDSHPAIEKILAYRQLVKLTGTYVDALLRKTDPSGRVHTTFDQTATATGRISSSEPNLQNIPVRTELGREIRRAFVPRAGWRLSDADYSQIELRVLAHMSGDANMVDAFRLGQDVHTRTAAEVYGVPMEQVTADMRRSAKAVNFGLVYGISEFGLSRNLGISRREAAQFIERYFDRYPGVKTFMDMTVQKGYRDGYAVTLMGRRRQLTELKSANANIRSFGERAAMNTPVQGTAADIIKLSMVRVHRALRDEGLSARLILQVHDELIVECPPEEVAQVEALLRRCMEGAAALQVPLKTDVHSGESWYETK